MAQREDLGDQRVVVVLVAVVAARVVGAPDLLAQSALVGEGQERVHRRARVGDGVLPFLPAGRRRLRGRLHESLREAAELVGFEEEDVPLLIREHVLREARVELRQTLVDLGVTLPGRARQRRSVVREAVVHELDQAQLVGSEARRVATLPHGADPREERRVLHDLRSVLGELRRHLRLHLTEFRRREVCAPDVEVSLHPIEVAPRPFQGGDRVLESRCARIARDRVDLLEVDLHPTQERGLQRVELHPVEGGHASVGTGPGREERVLLARIELRLTRLRGRAASAGAREEDGEGRGRAEAGEFGGLGLAPGGAHGEEW